MYFVGHGLLYKVLNLFSQSPMWKSVAISLRLESCKKKKKSKVDFTATDLNRDLKFNLDYFIRISFFNWLYFVSIRYF